MTFLTKLLALSSIGLLTGAASAQIVSTGPFTGQQSESFETQPAGQFTTCIVGRVLTGTTAGELVESMGYVGFYWLTTVLALPGIVLFWWMIRSGLVDRSLGTAGRDTA